MVSFLPLLTDLLDDLGKFHLAMAGKAEAFVPHALEVMLPEDILDGMEIVMGKQRVADLVVENDVFDDGDTARDAVLAVRILAGSAALGATALTKMDVRALKVLELFVGEDLPLLFCQVMFLRAFWTEGADEALADDDTELREERHRGDVEVHETVDRAHAVAGVDGREHLEAGLGCLHGDIGIACIADLAVEDD